MVEKLCSIYNNWGEHSTQKVVSLLSYWNLYIYIAICIMIFNRIRSISMCLIICVSMFTTKFDKRIYLNSFSTRPPGLGGSWQSADVRTPPGRGGSLYAAVFAPLMLKCSSLLHLSLTNDLGHLITNTEIHVVYTFSVRDISCKENVTVQVKLIPFFAGFCVGLGLNFSDFL